METLGETFPQPTKGFLQSPQCALSPRKTQLEIFKHMPANTASAKPGSIIPVLASGELEMRLNPQEKLQPLT